MKRELKRRIATLEAKPEPPMPPDICMEHLTPEQHAAMAPSSTSATVWMSSC